MLPYLPHAALLIAIALIFYKALLERETFFNLNRWLLVACLLLAFLIPTLEIPADWSIWPSATLTAETGLEANSIPEVAPQNDDVISSQTNLEAGKDMGEAAISRPSPVLEASKVPFYKTLDWKQILWMVYLIGIFIFGVNLFIQFFALLFQIIRHPSIKDGRYRIIELEADKAPYSFLNCIFINPTKYDWETYDQIIQHEKIHIAQAHSIDMILAELLVVVQWFNPAA